MYAEHKFAKTASLVAEIVQQVPLKQLANEHGHIQLLNLIANNLVANAGVTIKPKIVEVDYPIRSNIDSQCMLYVPEFDLCVSVDQGAWIDYKVGLDKMTEQSSLERFEVYSRDYTKIDDYSLVVPIPSQRTLEQLSKQYECFEDLIDGYSSQLESILVQDVVEVLNENLKVCSHQDTLESIRKHLNTITSEGAIFEISTAIRGDERAVSIYAKREGKLVLFELYAPKSPNGQQFIALSIDPTGEISSHFSLERSREKYGVEAVFETNPLTARLEALCEYNRLPYCAKEIAKYFELYDTIPQGSCVQWAFDEGDALEEVYKLSLTKEKALALLNSPAAENVLDYFIAYYDNTDKLYELSCIVEAYLSGKLNQNATEAIMSHNKSQNFEDLISSHLLASRLENMAPQTPETQQASIMDTSLRMAL
ncbi:hypothetical protein [Shewanella marisflavi]|uniref:hypothetical protein n=1 Tax=Shewanella marisflavi TaxID=260364 RepID=UPI003AAF6C87